MRNVARVAVGLCAVALLALPASGLAAQDKGTGGKGKADERAHGVSDNRKGPMSEKQEKLRQQALEMVLRGKAKGPVVEVAKGQFVKLSNEGKDKIFVVIAEFGNTRHPAFPDTVNGQPASDALTYDGPLHNSIPAPDRSVDNSTLWQPDYSHAHYEDMYFNRMARYYESQSSGRYSVEGDVTEWVKVPFNEARYGRDVCGDIVCNNTWFLIRDALSIWVKEQLDSGKSIADITSYLQTFDKQDRYDIDADGVFDEPDGFIDHFQIVHAGGDQAAGDPQQGSDAIWSHRWYAALPGGGPTAEDGPGGLPGVNIGAGAPSGALGGGAFAAVLPNNPTGVWVGDYTIQPENGGLGVFAHEFGHDLGLPDLYDTSGNTGGAENSTGFWTLMSSGANIGDGDGPPTGPNGIGDAPTDMGAWEKFQLGWLSAQGNKGPFYDVAFAGKTSVHKLGPNDTATKQGQALFVVLPNKARTDTIGVPKTGSYEFYSGAGDNLDTSMSHTASAGTLTADVNYDTELHFDYWFVEASTNGGSTWASVPTNLSTPANLDQSGFNGSGNGIDGKSNGWVSLTATLPAGTTHVRFRYLTDSGLTRPGVQIDNVANNGTVIGTAETADEGWTFTGFRRTTGTETSFHFNAYVAEIRNYTKYDSSLATAYNFGFLNSKPDWLEYFPYQDGLLISYWDESFNDNNVGDHPGGGLILPIDAHPTFAHTYDGHLVRPRIMSFDSTFGLEPTDTITINKDSQPTTISSQAAVSLFDDTKTWWYDADEHASTGQHVGRYEPGWFGVNPPKTGTTIRIVDGSRGAQGLYMQIEVNGRGKKK